VTASCEHDNELSGSMKEEVLFELAESRVSSQAGFISMESVTYI
jgi:hypothetical protein